MSGKMVFHFAAAVLVVFLSNGASEAKSIVRQDVPAGCPKFTPGFMTICSIGPYWCASNDDCKDGKICCPWGCGGECKEPVEEETAPEPEEEEPVEESTTPETEEEEPVDEISPPPAVEEEQPTPVSDPCYSSISPTIFCPVAVNWCETHEECGEGRVCCPFAKCGKRCRRNLNA